jgi:hypothetical protein
MNNPILRTAALFALAASAVTLVQAQPRPAEALGPLGTTNPSSCGGATCQPTASWIGELLTTEPALLNQPLARFIFPGTHDSGTYGLNSTLANETADNSSLITAYNTCQSDLNPYGLGSLCSDFQGGVATFGLPWARSQQLTIYNQLEAGVRSLDLRFYFDPTTGNYFAHHTFQGPELCSVNGTQCDSVSILAQILQFMQEGHSQEVILISFGSLVIGDGATTGSCTNGANCMTTAQLNEFFTQVYNQLGPYMAPAPGVCPTPPAPCPATVQFGSQATMGQMLAQTGSNGQPGNNQIIVFFEGLPAAAASSYAYTPAGPFAPYLWNNPASNSLFTLGGDDYPTPDDLINTGQNAWISDANVITDMNAVFTTRASSNAANDFWSVGLNTGLDAAGTALIRSKVCAAFVVGSIASAAGYCPAVNRWVISPLSRAKT